MKNPMTLHLGLENEAYVPASVVTDRQTDRQTDRTTTVPLAHAPRVNYDTHLPYPLL